jgi:hypothetical protein
MSITFLKSRRFAMKSITALGIGLASAVVSVFASSNVLAAATVYGGSVCHNYLGSDAKDIGFFSHGVVNDAPKSADPKKNTKKVICPVAKQINDYKGITTRVNIDSQGANTVTCTLYSRNWNGSSLGSKIVKNRGRGKESLTLQVPTSTLRSYFAIVCDLPSQEDAEIYSIEVLN